MGITRSPIVAKLEQPWTQPTPASSAKIASIAVFLASDDARWLTGEKLTASDGLR